MKQLLFSCTLQIGDGTCIQGQISSTLVIRTLLTASYGVWSLLSVIEINLPVLCTWCTNLLIV